MTHPIETIPHTIIAADGTTSFLRIKQRKSKKKWVVRYLRPNPDWSNKDLPKRKRRFYLRTLQVESKTLEGAVPKLQRAFIIHGFTEADGASLIHNNNHVM